MVQKKGKKEGWLKDEDGIDNCRNALTIHSAYKCHHKHLIHPGESLHGFKTSEAHKHAIIPLDGR